MQAQLNLNDYYINEYSFTVNRNHISGEKLCGSIDFDFDISRNSSHPLDFMINIVIDLNSGEEDFQKCNYRIHLNITGFFSFEDGSTEDTIKKMIAPSGLAMLYGVSRGIVSSTTAMSWHGTFVLPSLNLIEIIKRKVEDSSAPQKKTRIKKTKKQ